MSKFLLKNGFKWRDPKELDWNKHINISSKGFIPKVGLQYRKELRELHNDYPLAPYKIEVKREMLSDYRLKIFDLYNVLISNVRKLVLNCFDKEKYVICYEILQLYLRLELKLKKYIVY